jgi:hypothetical protein
MLFESKAFVLQNQNGTENKKFIHTAYRLSLPRTICRQAWTGKLDLGPFAIVFQKVPFQTEESSLIFNFVSPEILIKFRYPPEEVLRISSHKSRTCVNEPFIFSRLLVLEYERLAF